MYLQPMETPSGPPSRRRPRRSVSTPGSFEEYIVRGTRYSTRRSQDRPVVTTVAAGRRRTPVATDRRRDGGDRTPQCLLRITVATAWRRATIIADRRLR